MKDRPRVLFLCTGNSCRSQMAEAFCRQRWPDSIDCHSAGIEAHGLNQRAVKVMAEAGIDMSNRQSKTLEQLPTLNFEFVITVCNHANEHCPVFPLATTTLHQNFDDPPALSRNAVSEEEALQNYRRVRDEIDDFIRTLPDKLV